MNRRDPSSLLRAMFRSARFVLVYQGAALAVVVLSLLPATRSLLGVSASDVMRAMSAIMGSNLASTWAFHARGEESRTYRLIASGEKLTCFCGQTELKRLARQGR